MLTELAYFVGAGAAFGSHLMLSCIYIGANGGANCLFIVKRQTVDVGRRYGLRMNCFARMPAYRAVEADLCPFSLSMSFYTKAFRVIYHILKKMFSI